jgi:hypothetical protein
VKDSHNSQVQHHDCTTCSAHFLGLGEFSDAPQALAALTGGRWIRGVDLLRIWVETSKRYGKHRARYGKHIDKYGKDRARYGNYEKHMGKIGQYDLGNIWEKKCGKNTD